MTPPETDVFTFIKDWLWGPLLALVAWAWSHLNKRIDSVQAQADASDTDIRAEVNRQRDVSAKIFDKLEAMQLRSEDRHNELLKTIHNGLAGKADK